MTNGNRPQRLHTHIKPSGYRPRRRRTDAIVTAILGFAVGAALGLAFLSVVAVLAWLGNAIIRHFGYPALLVIVSVIGGVILAVVGYREVLDR